MPVLDTTVLIHLANRDIDALQALKQIEEEALLVPAHAAMEYLVGVDDPVADLQGLRSDFRLVHSSDAQVLEGARLRAVARRKQARPHWGDIHIAAVAVLHGTYVVTRNKKDFERLGVPAWDYVHDADPPA